jgi:hypothetical protein
MSTAHSLDWAHPSRYRPSAQAGPQHVYSHRTRNPPPPDRIPGEPASEGAVEPWRSKGDAISADLHGATVTEQIEQTQRNKRTFKINQAPHKLPSSSYLWPSLPSLLGSYPFARAALVLFRSENDRPGPVPSRPCDGAAPLFVFAPVGATFLCLCFQTVTRRRLLQAHSSF